MAWTAVTTDTFSRANSGPVSTPGNTTGVGDGWIDVAGNTGSVVSDQLNLLATSVTASSTVLARPAGEAAISSRIVVQFVAGSNNPVHARFAVLLRTNTQLSISTNGYLFQATTSGGTGISSGPYISGTASNPSSGANAASYASIVSGDTYSFDAWAYTNTVGPTFLQSSLTNVTTSTLLATTTLAYDTNATLQLTGQQAITAWEQSSGTQGTCVYTSAITYTGARLRLVCISPALRLGR